MNRLASFLLLFSLLLVCFTGCESKKPTELHKQDALVCKLTEYLKDLFASCDMPDTSTEEKIEKIKNGTQALLVDFHNSEYYFVCAYYDTAHRDEAKYYCCVTDYTWVRFEDSAEIREKYKNLDFIVGFRIDKASFVTDILSKDASVPCVEHFQEYVPQFRADFRGDDMTEFDVAFLYLHSTDTDTIYHSVSEKGHVLKTLPCLSLDGRYYFAVEKYTTYPDGRQSSVDLRIDFGKYYDSLISRMDTKSYTKTDDKGGTIFYGLIEIDDFVNRILE